MQIIDKSRNGETKRVELMKTNLNPSDFTYYLNLRYANPA